MSLLRSPKTLVVFLLAFAFGGGWCGSDIMSREAVRQAEARVVAADSAAADVQALYDSIAPLARAAVDSALASEPPAPISDTVYRTVRELVERVRESVDTALVPVVDSLATAVDSLETHIAEREEEWAADRQDLVDALYESRTALSVASDRISTLNGQLRARDDLVAAIERENRFALRWNRIGKTIAFAYAAGVVTGVIVE